MELAIIIDLCVTDLHARFIYFKFRTKSQEPRNKIFNYVLFSVFHLTLFFANVLFVKMRVKYSLKIIPDTMSIKPIYVVR